MFSDQIKYELEFARKSKIFWFKGAHSLQNWNFDAYFDDLKKLINQSNSIDKISIVNLHECFLEEFSQPVIDYMNTTGIEYYLSAATSSYVDGFFNPLVNIVFWRNTTIRYKINENSNKNPKINIFKESLYKSLSKSNKGILSIRKTNRRRVFLDSIFDKNNFDGIYRFANLTDPPGKINLHTENISKYPTTLELIEEYKKSYISFVIETYIGNNRMNMLTEKTLIAFLTKTMPIVLGGKNYVKELKDMGFYVWNDEFGFEDGDSIQTAEYIKINKFNNCIENYNKMSKSDIADMYNSNIDKIENNYKIVSELLFNKKTIL